MEHKKKVLKLYSAMTANNNEVEKIQFVENMSKCIMSNSRIMIFKNCDVIKHKIYKFIMNNKIDVYALTFCFETF